MRGDSRQRESDGVKVVLAEQDQAVSQAASSRGRTVLGVTDTERAEDLVRRTSGKRLTYRSTNKS